MSISLLVAVGIFALRATPEAENTGDLLYALSRYSGVPSLNLANGCLYALESETLNRSRNYTEAQRAQAARDNVVLPPRTNITLDFYEFPNVGGDLVSLGACALFWLLLLTLCEVRCKGRRRSRPRHLVDAADLDLDVLGEATRDMSDDVLCVRHLRKTYSSTVAVGDCSFGVRKGECFCLLGSNGAGKSSTFRSLACETPIDSGEISVLQQQSFAARIRHLGYCSQEDRLFENLTVLEHLLFYARAKGVPSASEHARSLVMALGLTHDANKVAQNLSGGNKRKLSVAIALVGSPKIVMLDEPSAGLDP